MSIVNTGGREEDGAMLRCGEATLVRRKGIYILHLKGSYAEMGRQHATLAAATCGDVGLRYFFDGLLENLIAVTTPSFATSTVSA